MKHQNHVLFERLETDGIFKQNIITTLASLFVA